MTETWHIEDCLLRVEDGLMSYTHSSGCVYYDLGTPCRRAECPVCPRGHLVDPTAGRIFVHGDLCTVDCERRTKTILRMNEGGRDDRWLHRELGMGLVGMDQWLDRFMPPMSSPENVKESHEFTRDMVEDVEVENGIRMRIVERKVAQGMDRDKAMRLYGPEEERDEEKNDVKKEKEREARHQAERDQGAG